MLVTQQADTKAHFSTEEQLFFEYEILKDERGGGGPAGRVIEVVPVTAKETTVIL